jgi:hypothetical protein
LPLRKRTVDHLAVDDDPGVEAVPGRVLGVGQPPQAWLFLHDPPEPVIGAKRVAAGRHKIEHARHDRLVDPGIGQARAHLGKQVIGQERSGAGPRHDMLGQHVETTRTERLAIALALLHRFERGRRFQEFEPVAGHQQRLARAIEPVVGPADPLQQPRGTLGRAHLHDKVDVTPVHAKVEAGGADQRAQFAARHRAFHLAPGLARERAVVDADGQRILVRVPQLLEDVFGKEARIGENQGRPVRADLRVDLGDCPGRGMTGPGNRLGLGQQDRDLRAAAPASPSTIATDPASPCGASQSA